MPLSQGTFYGAGGAGKSGMCMLNPGFNGVGITVALNGAQFGDGATCGKCIKATGTGEGLGTTPIVGPIFATVDNLCPECKFGDVDFGLGGDGRWKINWDFIDCGEARGGGSNLPSKTMDDNDGNHHRHLDSHHLRGGAMMMPSSPAAKTFLEPGEMISKDGIVKIADFIADDEVQQPAEQQP